MNDIEAANEIGSLRARLAESEKRAEAAEGHVVEYKRRAEAAEALATARGEALREARDWMADYFPIHEPKHEDCDPCRVVRLADAALAGTAGSENG